MPPQVFDQIVFEQILAAALDELGIFGRLLVGVSGGADSVALLRGLVSLRDDRSLEVVAAHLNHQLRGDESTADASLVRQLCESLNVPLAIESIDVRRLAEESGCGIEEAARTARYDFLTQTALEQGCSWVLVAHTADDQVETILHHILRGTGLDGLRGMPRTRPLAEGITLARPLLDVTRAEIEAYLRSIGQDWRDDATNRDPMLTRNRIRHELLPSLRDQYNPQIDAALVRLAQQAADVQSVIDPLADRLLAECCLNAAPDVLRLDATPFAKSPVHLVREVVKRAWRRAGWPLSGMGFDHWTSAARVALGQAAAIDLPGGVHAQRRGTLVVLTRT